MKRFKNKYFYLLAVFAIISLFQGQGLTTDAPGGFIYDAKGKRDPFIPLVTQDGRIIEPPKRKEKTEGPPQLEGIIYDPRGASYAVMEGEVFRVGDAAGDYQIIKIEAQKVVLQKAGREFTVELKKED
jgi:hypothetical protein